jgi:hypothetical protein
VVIAQPQWWLEHLDELADALAVAATLPDSREPVKPILER